MVDLASPRVLRSLGPLAGYLRRERPRVVVSSMSHANLVALWAARLRRTGTPVVVTEHNTMSQSAREQGWLERRLWPPAAAHLLSLGRPVVAVSRGAADDFARTAGMPRERVEVVYNPVIMPGMMARARQAPGHPWFGPGQPPVVLGVGRLTRQKDFPTLIRAFAERAAAAARTADYPGGRGGPGGAGGAGGRAGAGGRCGACRASARTRWPTCRARRCSCCPPPGRGCPPC